MLVDKRNLQQSVTKPFTSLKKVHAERCDAQLEVTQRRVHYKPKYGTIHNVAENAGFTTDAFQSTNRH